MNPEFPGVRPKISAETVWSKALTGRRRQVAFILNPCAGAGRAVVEWTKLIGHVEELFGRDGYTVSVTKCQWDAVVLTMERIAEGFNVIVSIGGDGTHNEVVNGYMRAGGLLRGVEFATLSIGSGSDLDKTLYQDVTMTNLEKLKLFAEGPSMLCDVGLLRCASAEFVGRSLPSSQQQTSPKNEEEGRINLEQFIRPTERMGYGPTFATDSDTDPSSSSSSSTTTGGVRTSSSASSPLPDVDARKHREGGEGQVVERFFINIAACGVGGAVCRIVNSTSKALGGFATFCYATVRTSITWSNPPVRWQTNESDEWREESVYMFLLGNGSYQGGGMKPVPHADLADGLLDLVVIRDFGPYDVFKIPSIYSGTHFQHKPRVFGSRVTTVNIEPRTDTPVWLEADGETPGKLPAAFSILPGAIRIIVPPSFVQARLQVDS